MALADSSFFSAEHIQQQRFGASAVLAEQAIHSLELVAELAAAGLSYQFKGGNSLLLILDTPRRFSIDVDIATDESRERIEECLNSMVARFGAFTRWEPRRHKTKPWLPISSYYLYYQSAIGAGPDANIMLDAQMRRSPYKTRMAPVVCGELYRSQQTIELPLAASIAGDKLLTMGPATMGIPLGKGKQAQRLKHVFDVSSLVAADPDLDDIRASFHACIEHENEIQQKTITARDVLLDTVRFCATVAPLDSRPEQPSTIADGVLRENAEGLPEFASHLFAAGYDWRRLQLDMARVAWCIAAVCTQQVDSRRFLDVARRTARPVPDEVPGLRLEPEAGYYWAHVNAVLGDVWRT